MIHKPEVQRRAQAEIDAIVGEERSPVWEDWDDLPYVRAIQKEVLRWRPVLPIGVAHSLQQGNVYLHNRTAQAEYFWQTIHMRACSCLKARLYS